MWACVLPISLLTDQSGNTASDYFPWVLAWTVVGGVPFFFICLIYFRAMYSKRPHDQGVNELDTP
jgi:hypothetical protein